MKEITVDGGMWEVYTIVDKEGFEKSFWVKVGAMFPNRDGTFNIYLDALPINGRLHARPKSSPAETKNPSREERK